LKLSRTSWMIISAGVFIVILAGLGLTYSQQSKEKTELSDTLSITEKRLDKFQITTMRQDLDELQEQIDENLIRLSEDKDRLRQPIESVDVTDEFFLIASYCNVMVMNISSSDIAKDSLEGIPCSTISLNSSVNGTVSDLINFVISLNNDYSAGVVESAQISIPESSANTSVTATAGIRMIIYSYEGA
jgi:hypothetical protein